MDLQKKNLQTLLEKGLNCIVRWILFVFCGTATLFFLLKIMFKSNQPLISRTCLNASQREFRFLSWHASLQKGVREVDLLIIIRTKCPVKCRPSNLCKPNLLKQVYNHDATFPPSTFRAFPLPTWVLLFNPPISSITMPRIQTLTAKNKRLQSQRSGTKVLCPKNSNA